MADTFCPLPWKNLATSPSGTLRLCCDSAAGINLARTPDGGYHRLPTNLEQAWNAEMYQEVRRSMLAGEWPAACEPCRNAEANGRASFRQSNRDTYDGLSLDRSKLGVHGKLEDIDQLDIRLGNLCNLKCRMCSPYSSSAWFSDWEQMGDEVVAIPEENKRRLRSAWHESPALMESFRPLMPGLREIYLTGGEPMLSRGNRHLLELCVSEGAASRISLRYNTNGTIWDDEMVRLWSHFSKIQLKISIDAVGPLNDYIRYPSKWEQVIGNVRRYQELATRLPIEINIDAAFQAYNAFQITDLIRLFHFEMGLPVRIGEVRNPAHLGVGVIAPSPAAKARERIAALPRFGQKDFLCSLLDSSSHHLWGKFLSFTDGLDRIRGQNVRALVPELFTA